MSPSLLNDADLKSWIRGAADAGCDGGSGSGEGRGGEEGRIRGGAGHLKKKKKRLSNAEESIREYNTTLMIFIMKQNKESRYDFLLTLCVGPVALYSIRTNNMMPERCHII